MQETISLGGSTLYQIFQVFLSHNSLGLVTKLMVNQECGYSSTMKEINIIALLPQATSPIIISLSISQGIPLDNTDFTIQRILSRL